MKYILSILAWSGILAYGIAGERSYQNKEFAIFSFNVTITNDFKREIRGLENYINTIQGYDEMGQNKLTGKIYEIIYIYLEEKLEKQFEMNILPINTFTNNVKYNAYKYPNAQIKRAHRFGNSQYYLKIDTKIETVTPKDAKGSVLFRNKTHPKVTVSIEIYDNESILPVKKVTGIAQSSIQIRVEERFLKGIVVPAEKSEIEELGENLYVLLIRAMNRAINEI